MVSTTVLMIRGVCREKPTYSVHSLLPSPAANGRGRSVTLDGTCHERRTGKGSHLLFVHPESRKEVWVTKHGHDAGRLGNRILRDAGFE